MSTATTGADSAQMLCLIYARRMGALAVALGPAFAEGLRALRPISCRRAVSLLRATDADRLQHADAETWERWRQAAAPRQEAGVHHEGDRGGRPTVREGGEWRGDFACQGGCRSLPDQSFCR
ncbi:hypothetical protein LIU39_22130 [Streptomyces sp. SF28]|nr:hypothetical protein [Streptomyces pinistramenti]